MNRERSAFKLARIRQLLQHCINDRSAKVSDHNHMPLPKMHASLCAINEVTYPRQEFRSNKEQPTLSTGEIYRHLH